MLESPMADKVAEDEDVSDDELLFDDAKVEPSEVEASETALDPDAIFSSTEPPSEHPSDGTVVEGDVLVGKYRVVKVPGRNGLGIVVDVKHVELARDLTLKYLGADACSEPRFVKRFFREARDAVRIDGEHVARVTDVGRLEFGAPYMVREALHGPDLSEVIRVRGPLPVAEAVDYLIQTCEAVAEGHVLGIVHRNLRPTTLVVTRRGDGPSVVKVFDFGAAEALHVDPFTHRALSLVGTSAILSSVPYMAPEQIRDPYDVDVRVDVYALGAILHELLCGEPVVSGNSAPALLVAAVADAPTPLRTLRQDLPAELEAIVLRCLAKDRNRRYTSVADLVLALQPFGSKQSAVSVHRVLRLGRHPAAGSFEPSFVPEQDASTQEPAFVPSPSSRAPSPRRETLPYAPMHRVAPAPLPVAPLEASNVAAPTAPPAVVPRPLSWFRPPARSQTDTTILPANASTPAGVSRTLAPPVTPGGWGRLGALGLLSAATAFCLLFFGVLRSPRAVQPQAQLSAPPSAQPVAAAQPGSAPESRALAAAAAPLATATAAPSAAVEVAAVPSAVPVMKPALAPARRPTVRSHVSTKSTATAPAKHVVGKRSAADLFADPN